MTSCPPTFNWRAWKYIDARTLVKEIVDRIRENYDYIIIDCSPSLGFVTMNALTATDTAIIPINPSVHSISGLPVLFETIEKMKLINRNLQIGGMVLTRVSMQKNNFFARNVEIIRNQCEGKIRVFNTEIPYTVKALEALNAGISIFAHVPSAKITDAYQKLIDEILETL